MVAWRAREPIHALRKEARYETSCERHIRHVSCLTIVSLYGAHVYTAILSSIHQCVSTSIRESTNLPSHPCVDVRPRNAECVQQRDAAHCSAMSDCAALEPFFEEPAWAVAPRRCPPEWWETSPASLQVRASQRVADFPSWHSCFLNQSLGKFLRASSENTLTTLTIQSSASSFLNRQ